MNPSKVVRDKVRRLVDLPNVGPAMAGDLELLGFSRPAQLAGADPLQLYASLCHATGERQDPCVLDVFMSITHFLAGGPAQPWWHYTGQRKRQYATLPAPARDGATASPAGARR